MKIIHKRAFARVGLLGNPSDGYFGKTLSVTIPDFSAQVVIYEWPELEVILSRQDGCRFDSINDLIEDVSLNGLYGGLRLVKAAIKLFGTYCETAGIRLPKQNFSLRYETDIPRQVGLAGSSAIITAVLKGLIEFYDVTIPNELLANLVLEVETKEIGIAAGLQDRVCQVYEGLIYMDFERSYFEAHGYGQYERLPVELLPPLYLAYRRNLSKISGIYHSNLRQRWEEGDPVVHEAMKEFAKITAEGRECLLNRDQQGFSALMDRNFAVRSKLVRLDPVNIEMVNLARRFGASAKYAGSGGAIIGVRPAPEPFEEMKRAFSEIGCEVIVPALGWIEP